jgi:hypothetical protein
MFDNIKGLPRAFAVQLMRIGERWTPHSRGAMRGRLLSVGYRGKSPTPWEWKEEHNSGIQECENNGWREERHDGKMAYRKDARVQLKSLQQSGPCFIVHYAKIPLICLLLRQ